MGRQSPNPRTRNKYKAIAVALIEGGALYTLTLLVWAVFAIIPQYLSGLPTLPKDIRA